MLSAARFSARLRVRLASSKQREAAGLDFLFRRALRRNRFPRDMADEFRRVEPYAEERADAEHAENVLRGGVGINDPVVGVGDQDAVPRRDAPIGVRVERVPGVLQDHARRFHQALAAAIPQLSGGNFKADDGDGVVAVVDAVGVHFEGVGVDEVPAKAHQRLSVGQGLDDQRLRFPRHEGADGGQPQGLHHGMGAGLRQDKQMIAVPGWSVEARLSLRKICDEGKTFADIFQKLRLPSRNVRMGAAKRAYVVHVSSPLSLTILL